VLREYPGQCQALLVLLYLRPFRSLSFGWRWEALRRSSHTCRCRSSGSASTFIRPLRDPARCSHRPSTISDPFLRGLGQLAALPRLVEPLGLILAGREHLRQHKLLLPPFPGSCDRGLPRRLSRIVWAEPRWPRQEGETIRSCATGCGRWNLRGDFARAVFVARRAGIETRRSDSSFSVPRAAVIEMQDGLRSCRTRSPRPLPWVPWGRFRRRLHTPPTS